VSRREEAKGKGKRNEGEALNRIDANKTTNEHESEYQRTPQIRLLLKVVNGSNFDRRSFLLSGEGRVNSWVVPREFIERVELGCLFI
jgi:hypothetical protein